MILAQQQCADQEQKFLDKELGNLFASWIKHYRPPADLPLISSAAVMNAFPHWAQQCQNKDWVAIVSFKLAQKLAEAAELPQQLVRYSILPLLAELESVVPNRQVKYKKGRVEHTENLLHRIKVTAETLRNAIAEPDVEEKRTVKKEKLGLPYEFDAATGTGHLAIEDEREKRQPRLEG